MFSPHICICEYVLICTCDYVTSAGVTELRTLRWGDEPGLSSWAQYKHKCHTARQESQDQKEGGGGRGDDGSRSQKKLEDVVLLALKMEEGAISQELSAGASRSWKSQNSNSTRGASRRHTALQTP